MPIPISLMHKRGQLNRYIASEDIGNPWFGRCMQKYQPGYRRDQKSNCYSRAGGGEAKIFEN